MPPDFTANLIPLLPEILLAGGAMALLLLGVFQGDRSTRPVSWLSVGLLVGAALLVLIRPQVPTVGFWGSFVVDSFTQFAKVLILLGAALVLIMSLDYLRRETMERFEFPILVLLSTLGAMMMVSANDLITLYLGLELQSLAAYVLAAFQRDSTRSTEAGLKYFILGALSSGMLLYGASLVYGFSGTVNFDALATAIAAGDTGLGLVFGLVFLTAGLAFKISAVPFHMWTPDVYEGAPTPVTAFFATAAKVAAFALFMRLLLVAFAPLVDQWQQIIVFISIASMALGAFAAIGQTNIKRLIAYSSIGHVGYALIGLATGTPEGATSVLAYLAIYLVMSAGVFVCILAMRRPEGMVENISDLAGLGRNQPALALAFAFFMFSLAGIPPFAGFFAKLYVFLAAVHSEMYVLAVIGVLTSVVATYYYLRVVKVMYFDEPAEPFAQPLPGGMQVILAGTGLFTTFLFIKPALLTGLAAAAAAALFPFQ